MKKTFLVLTMLIGFSAFLFNACSKSSDSSTPVVTVPPSPVGGVWLDSISGSAFYLTLNNDLSYSFSRNTSPPYESGTYTLADTTIIFLSSTQASCPNWHGKYSYKIDSVTTSVITPRLTIALYSDSCATRRALINGKWLKK